MADLDYPHLHIEFYTDPIENPRRSAAEGRPIFEDREFVRIRFRGDRNRTLVAPADERSLRDRETNGWLSYKERFPKHYAAFKAGQAYIGEGTPLSELPFLTESKRAELRALNVHTAESLAGIDGVPLSRLGMGGRGLKDQAQAYIDNAKGSADVTRMTADNAAMKEQMLLLQQQIADLVAGRSPTPIDTRPQSQFASWTDAALKTWIGEQTGAKPKGNPSHATLVSSADDINAQKQAAA